MSTTEHSIPDHQRNVTTWRRSGTWMVIIMFLFAMSMIALMYLYWEMHTRPFRPLQIAINARYPNSMPRVIGGKHKSHQPDSKPTLRIVIAVDFDPTDGLPRPPGTNPEDEDRLTLTDTMQVDPRVEDAYKTLLELANENTDLNEYQVVEIFLEHRRPEKRSRTLFATRPLQEWLTKYSITPTSPEPLPPASSPVSAPAAQ
jgi:hypothetical protein